MERCCSRRLAGWLARHVPKVTRRSGELDSVDRAIASRARAAGILGQLPHTGLFRGRHVSVQHLPSHHVTKSLPDNLDVKRAHKTVH